MKGLEMSVSNRDSKLSGGLTCKEIMAASLSLKDNSFEILAEDNHLGAGYKYANQDELVNKGEFIAVGDLARTDAGKVSLGINILPSMLHLNSKEWSILPFWPPSPIPLPSAWCLLWALPPGSWLPVQLPALSPRKMWLALWPYATALP